MAKKQNLEKKQGRQDAQIQRRPEKEIRVLEFLYRWFRPIRAGDLAKRLRLKHQTLNSILKKLGKQALITWEPYGLVELTSMGKEKGVHYLRHHHLLERFLKETLDLSDQESHDESVRITPFVSCNLIQAICRHFNIDTGHIAGPDFPDTRDYCVESENL